MVLHMKVEAVNFRKSQEISLLCLDCFITKFRNKRRGGGEANRSLPGPNRFKTNSYFNASGSHLAHVQSHLKQLDFLDFKANRRN